MYGNDIAAFDANTIPNEYKALYEKAKEDYQSLLGKYNQTKGLFAEFAIINQLRLHAHQKQELFISITHNLPEDFRFVEYEHVWSYKTARPDKRDIWIDGFARAGGVSNLIIKSRSGGQKPSTYFYKHQTTKVFETFVVSAIRSKIQKCHF